MPTWRRRICDYSVAEVASRPLCGTEEDLAGEPACQSQPVRMLVDSGTSVALVGSGLRPAWSGPSCGRRGVTRARASRLAGVILIDPPMWPAHHTLFSHLISDTSLEQLHQFAAAADVPEAAFDGDHYDVPQSRHQQLIRQGAVPVSAGELIRRLRVSGLRVPARERPSRVLGVLRRRWQHTMPGAHELGEELLRRWSEPHRRYHTPAHLLDVLTAQEHLCAPAAPPLVSVLAAWFHDAVHHGSAGEDEQASAELARTRLADAAAAGALPRTAAEASGLIAEVERLVLLTRTHSPDADDVDGALLSDADLAVLARPAAGYTRYANAVRAEYHHLCDQQWRTGRSVVLDQLLAQDQMFRTPTAFREWEQRARENLANELAALRATT